MCFYSLNAQNLFSGIVKDEQSRQPLVGANVIVPNQVGRGAATAVNGSFNFVMGTEKELLVKVSMIGYQETSFLLKLNEDNIIELKPQVFLKDEIVVQSTRANNNTPTTYTNISKEELSRMNVGQDMPFLLQQTPSVIVNSDAGNGIGYTGITIRGSDITRINVTVNGIPINDAESHGVFWVNMPDFASSVENIQIQRGVGTSTNGSGAFGASISLQTNTLRDKAYGEFDASYGSFNAHKSTIRAGTGLLNGKWTVDARLSRINSNGYIDRASADLRSFFVSAGRYGKKSVFRANIFSGKEITYQSWNGLPQDSLKTNRRFNSAGQIFNNNGTSSFYDNEVDNYQQDHYQLFYSLTLPRNFYLNTAAFLTRGRGFYEQFRQNDRLSRYGIEPITIGGDTLLRSDLIRRRWLDNYFYGAYANIEKHFSSKWHLQAGGGYNRYDGKHFGEVIWARFAGNTNIRTRYYDNDAVKTDINSFVKINYLISDKINSFVDVQYRGVYYEFLGFDNQLRNVTQDASFNFFNPKFGLQYLLNEKTNFYASFAIGQREPVRRDFTESSPQSRPKHEELYNTEVGYKWHGKKGLFGTTVYHMYYVNQLVLSGQINDVGASTRINVPSSYRLGIELEGAYQFTSRLRWNGNLALSRNRVSSIQTFYDLYDANFNFLGNVEGPTYSNTPIAMSASVIAASDWRFEVVKGLNLQFQTRYVGRQFLDNSGLKERSLNPFTVSDLRMQYDFKTKNGSNWLIGLHALNVFNKMYAPNGYTFGYLVDGEIVTENFYFPQAGFNWMFQLGIKF